MNRLASVIAILVLVGCTQTAHHASAPPIIPFVERPASLDATMEEKVKTSVIAALPEHKSATFSDLRIVDYTDLQGGTRWVVCGTVNVVGGQSPGKQIFAYAPHTDIVRFGPGDTRPQQVCA